MIVLRLTAGEASEEVRTLRTEVVLGSDPTADISLPQVGLAPRAARLRQVDAEVEVEIFGGDRCLRMRVGDEIEIDGVQLALIGLLPPEPSTTAIFGSYEDDPIASPPKHFELAAAGPAPAATALPRADTPPKDSQPTASQPPPRKQTASSGTARAKQPPSKKKTPAQAAVNLKPLKFPEPDFGTELVAQLKRSPFFVLSLGFHLLVFFILSLFDSTARPERLETGIGAMSASLDAADEELSDRRAREEDEGLELREPELPELPESPLEEPDKPPPRDDKAPPPAFSVDMPEDKRKPLEIGILPALSAARGRVAGKQPKVASKDLKQDFRRGAAGSSNQRSAEIVRGQLGRGRRGYAALDDLMREDVLVVDGSFDHIERVLDALHIKYEKKSPWSLSAPEPEDFKSYKVVFWNCGEALTKARTAGVAKYIRTFVRDGGYLFTTDWGVATVLAHAFPNYLTSNGNRAHLPEMTLPIEPAPSARDHPLLEGVFRPNVQGKWWLEQASFDVAVGRKDKVTVLIESPMLRDTFNRSPVVAATFHYGRGRVLHAMGHYYQEAGNLAGTISAHRLALNFVLLRLDQDRTSGRR